MEDSAYSSTLGQRLQRRLVKPAGVIYTQQLHCHYQATQGTAGRLVQKSVLPEQVKFRYGSGVLQPTAIMSRLQRQRTESADGFDGQWRVNPGSYSGTGKTAQTFVQTQPRPFQNSRDKSRELAGKSPTAISQKVTVMTKPLVKETNHNQTTTPVSLTPISLVAKKPKSASSTPLGKTIKETGEKGSRQGTQPQLKINRKGTLAEINTLSRHESNSVQQQKDPKSIPDLPLAQTNSPSSPTKVSRKEDTEDKQDTKDTVIQTKIIPNQPKLAKITSPSDSFQNSAQDLPLAKTVSTSSPTTVSKKEDKDDTVIQAKLSPNFGKIISQSPTITQAIQSQTIINSTAIPDLPLAKTNSKSYQSTIQAKNKPLSKGIIQTKLTETNYQPTGIIQKQPGNSPVQLSQKASIASNPTVVSTTPTQLSSSSELNRVWLKTTNTIEASKDLSSRSSHHQKLRLPLAITQIKTNGAIARQTNAVENSTVQARSGNATTQMSTPETAPASAIDLTKVAEQVSRILARKLMVERERRGI